MVPASPTPPAARPSLCVGMATHGDYDGVWFTIQALRLYHPEVADDLSFVVIDNDPDAATAAALRAIGDWVPRYRYVPFAATPAPRCATSSSAKPTRTSSAAWTPTCCSRRGRSKRCCTGSERIPAASTSSRGRCSTTT